MISFDFHHLGAFFRPELLRFSPCSPSFEGAILGSKLENVGPTHKTDNINDSTTVTIIAKERDPVNLRLKEAYYTCKLRPEINDREERSELTDILFWHINLNSKDYCS